MKAAFLTASVSRAGGGVFEICRQLAQSLAATQPVKVDVLGLKDASTQQDLAQWENVKPQVFPIQGPAQYGFSSQMVPALTHANPQVSHVHGLWMYPSLAAARWSRKTRRPFLITIHGMLEPWALQHSGWKKMLAALLVERSVLTQASCLHVNTEQELQSVRSYGLKNPVCVIPNGIDLPQAQASLQAPWDAQPARKTLLYLGRLHPKKNLPGLLKAWSAAGAKARGEWILRIAGWDQGNHEAELKGLVRDLDVDSSVEFLGPLFGEQKAAALANANAFVLPSFSEGLPMAVLEAWANRLPVLMTPECNLSIGFEVNAALRMNPDPGSITEALSRLFSSGSENCRAIGEAGFRLVQSDFSWPKVASELLGVYQWLLGNGPQPACVRYN